MEAGRWLTDRRAAVMSQQGDDQAGDEMRRGEEKTNDKQKNWYKWKKTMCGQDEGSRVRGERNGENR